MKSRLLLPILIAGLGLVLLLAAVSQSVQAEPTTGVSENPQQTLSERGLPGKVAVAAGATSNRLPGDTIVGGTITTDTTWTTAGNPYFVDDNIRILNGATLSVEPGVEVRLGIYEYIEVQSGGRLLAEGTATQPITFTSEYGSPSKGDWGEIRVLSGGSARLARCDISYGGDWQRSSLHIQTSDVQVRDCRIHDNSSGGVYVTLTGPGPVLENLAIENNDSAAVKQNPNSAPTYRNLSFSGNDTDAIVISNGSVTGGIHWDLAQAGVPVQVQGNVGIFSGSFLSLGPGTELRFTEGSFIDAFGAFYALGMATAPITLTGVVEQPGAWIGVNVRDTGSAILQNVNMQYGGGVITGGGSSWGGFLLRVDSSSVVVQNSRIYGSLVTGVLVTSGAQPSISYSQIYSNASAGLVNSEGYGPAATVDVRNNWWGDPSGPYHQTLNPDGTGDSVWGPVLLDPWLQSPETQDTLGRRLLILQVGGPSHAYPGQTRDYAVSYGNFLTQTVESAVVTLLLPDTAEYMDSTGGGIYWPELHQVFWRLGDLAPESRGGMSVRVLYDWGLPDGLEDGVMALLGGTNLPESKLEVAPYLSYTPVEIVEETTLTGGELAAERRDYPELDTVYTQALAGGFSFLGASRLTLSVGELVTQVVLIDPEREAAMYLRRQGEQVLASTFDGMSDSYAVRDATGGMTMTLGLRASEYWGSWAVGGAGSVMAAETSVGSCFFNCLVTKVPLKILTKKIKAIKYALKSAACVKYVLSDFTDENAGAKCMLLIKNIPGVGDILSITKCEVDCRNNPNSYQCTEDTVTCVYSDWNLFCMIAPSCFTTIRCEGGYYSMDLVSNPCAYFEFGKPVKCVEGIGCVACDSADSTQQAQAAPAGVCAAMGSAGGTCSGSNTTISIPHDPNAKYGPDGDLLPGQEITYTVTYENEGAGQAYGVFVLDQLDEDLDMGSVSVQGGGQLITPSRTLIWQIGELASKGQPGSSGVVTFTARLKEGLPSGTVVTNQATVYFPSVGEETPTNMVVNVVQPVVALPQVVETTYGQPVPITLQGLEVSGLPLTYTVFTSPRRGEVSGEGANLIYTPPADFVGEDGFTFKASNGITESRASSVRVIVSPSSADATPPAVRWTYPSSGAMNVPISAIPVLTDAEGRAYAPALIVQFSEPISPTTVTTETLTLSAAGGGRLLTSVWYDGTLDRAIIVPRERLVSEAQYTGTVTQGIKDASGNPLASVYTWSFQTGEAASQQWRSYLSILMK